MNIAFFDFDGTITTKDSLEDFIKFAVGPFKYYLGLLVKSPLLVAYKLKLISNNEAKARLMSHYFKGWSLEKFDAIATEYTKLKIKKIIKQDAYDRLIWHKNNGDKVVIVSASMRNWLLGWAANEGFDLLCTELEVLDGKLTGRFSCENCYGAEKVSRIKSSYDLEEYELIYAYGDTSGDRPMLSLAHQAFYRHFNGPTLD